MPQCACPPCPPAPAALAEVVELWCRDPVECHYAPYRIFKRFEDGKYSNREVNEMWNADWWWEIQKLLPKGATLIPIILASDKTQLTRFSGGQQAWPVYLTIGNIDKSTRRHPSMHATVLLGYIPVAKLEIFSKKKRSAVGYQLFHDCIRRMLQSLKKAGEDGVDMDCADGFVRKMYLILAAYIADYPEQCLVCCCGESSCPGCTCEPNCCGDVHTPHATWRCRTQTLQIFEAQANREHPPEFAQQNLRAINPFWADLPHCDIFRSMTPDLLHELHNGVFDHLVKWSTSTMAGEEAEVDQRYRSMTPHPALCHFKKGISLTTQWTGTERKNMEKVFLGVLANATDQRVQLSAAGILDLSTTPILRRTVTSHSRSWTPPGWLFTITRMSSSTLRSGSTSTSTSSISSNIMLTLFGLAGTADGFNTEGTECLHIDLAKLGYRATNKKAHTHQMTVWLRRQESVHKFSSYLQWTIPGYIAPSTSEDADPEEDEDTEEQNMPDYREDAVKDSGAGRREIPAEGDDGATLDEYPSPPPFTIAKKAAFPHVSVANIISEFHAPAFIDSLSRFLQSKSIICSSPVSLTRYLFACTRGGKVRVPQMVSLIILCSSPTNTFTGLSVARMRVIFKIPSDFGSYPDPVAYVDWFKSLQRPVSLSSRAHCQRSSIIPITEIVRSCHLIPVFSRKANPGWTSATVLDLCPKFYLNPYLPQLLHRRLPGSFMPLNLSAQGFQCRSMRIGSSNCV
ncbi:hypothetical protein B0H14DRAFT_3091164 [Mycena olivaceomarginata]|nr:hypothetical protein B0H14DRAFT_3091164 [Mycena olivaceomarginata]